MQSHVEETSPNEHFWLAKHLSEMTLRRTKDQQCNLFGKERRKLVIKTGQPYLTLRLIQTVNWGILIP